MILWSNHHNQKSLFYLSSSWLLLLQRKRERERDLFRDVEKVSSSKSRYRISKRDRSLSSLSTDTTGCSHQMQDRLRETLEREAADEILEGKEAKRVFLVTPPSSLVFSTVSWFFLQPLPYNLCLKREAISSSIWVYSQSCDFIDIPRPTKSFVVWEEGRKEIERITVKFPSLSFSMILSFIFPKKRESNDEQRVSCDFYCLSSQKVFDTNSRDREKRDDQWGINKKEK